MLYSFERLGLSEVGFGPLTSCGAAGGILVALTYARIWGTTSVTIRHRLVPTELQGRVSSVNGVGVFSTLVLGALLGGVIASKWGITGPFWFGFVGLRSLLPPSGAS